MDEAGKAWMEQNRLAEGAPVGERVTTRRGKEWQVYRATRASRSQLPSPPGEDRGEGVSEPVDS
jgi:hypothetical protein